MGASCCKLFNNSEIGDSYATIRGSSNPNPTPADPVKLAPTDNLKRSQVDPGREERRRQVAEAAEKRRLAEESRGIQNIESVRRAKERQLEKERQEQLAARNPHTDTPLRWQVT